MAYELKRCLLILGIALGLGLAAGAPWPAVALAALALLAWQLSLLHGMWRQVREDSETLSPPRGMWTDIAAHFERLHRRNRKRKKRLHKITQRFQDAADANPDGAVIVDADDRIEWMSRAASQLLGLRQGQDLGQMITHLLRSPGFADYLARWDAIEAFEMDSPNNPGQRLLLRMVPYGNKKRMLMVRDITRLHSLEMMRKDFVANVSHELRSPLTVIKGYLETFSDDDEVPERLRRPVLQMSQQSERMCVIVEDLLRLSRLESEPGGAASQRIDLVTMLVAVRDDALALRSGRHRFELEVDDTLFLLGDYNELYSAFSNIVFNAVQYTPEDGLVRIRWAAGSDGGGVLSVSDSGVGIEAQHLPRLTERFYRVDKARSREMGGTGLGLAIVKHILMRHDARLEIGSEPGEGSTFSCVFPSDRVEARVLPEQRVAQA